MPEQSVMSDEEFDLAIGEIEADIPEVSETISTSSCNRVYCI